MRTLFACLIALVLASPALTSSALAAGDVSVVLNGRVLRVVGDDQPNALDIVSGAENGEIALIGIDGITVNGFARLNFAGVGTLNLAMGAGSDDVLIADLLLLRDLRVRMEDGHDVLVVENTVVRRRMTFDGGDGHDRFTARAGCVFRRSIRANGRDGQDEFVLRDTRVLGRVRLATGDGNDLVVIDRSAFNRFAMVNIRTGEDADEVRIQHSVFFLNVNVSMGDGDDYTYLHDVDFEEDFDLEAGRDDDDVHVDHVDFDEDVELDGGSGHDRLELDGHVEFPDDHDDHDVELRRFEHRS